jgi:biotin carboxyl carrier protein
MRRSLLAAVIGTTLAGCTGEMAGLVNAAQQAAQQQAGKPSASASPAPAASPTTAASARPTAAAVTASVSLEGQAASIKQEASAVFTPAVGTMHAVQYTIGARAQDGSVMLVVSITANKPFTAVDLSKADLAAFSVQVFRFGGAGVLSTHRNLSPIQIPKEDITLTPSGGKLDIKANLTSFVGLGTLNAAQIDLKGLPTS